MTSVINLLFGDLKERLEIKNLGQAEFAARLKAHVDENKKGLLSNSKCEFFGTVTKNSFKLQINKNFKTDDFRIFGTFYEEDDNIRVDIECSRSLVATLMPIGIAVLIIYMTINTIIGDNLNLGFILFLFIILVAFLLVNHFSMTNEIELVTKTLKTIFRDKEIMELMPHFRSL